jgi:hypothetical protein
MKLLDTNTQKNSKTIYQFWGNKFNMSSAQFKNLMASKTTFKKLKPYLSAIPFLVRRQNLISFSSLASIGAIPHHSH